MLRTTAPLAGTLAVLAGATLGYATAGADGGVTAAVAVALGIGAVAGLAWAVDATVGRPDRTKGSSILAGGLVIAGWTVVPTSVLGATLPTLPLWAYVAGVALVGVFLGVTCDSPVGGLWHGLLAGGAGGVLFVYVAIYESFTMQPELDGIVLIAGLFAPLSFSLAGGLGGAVGVSTLDAVRKVQVSK